jgi:copper chaperone
VSDTRVYDVPDISCGHCKAAIEGAVDAVDGVEAVAVDVDDRTVTVTGDAEAVAVEAAITDAGYAVSGTR